MEWIHTTDLFIYLTEVFLQNGDLLVENMWQRYSFE